MRSLRTRGHSTPTHQAAETSPTDFTRMLLKRLLLMKNEGLPSRFALKWSLAPLQTRSNLMQELDLYRPFLRFSIISPKFFNWFCSFTGRLHCVQDIPKNNSFFFFSKKELSCFNDFTTKNVDIHVRGRKMLQKVPERKITLCCNKIINAQYVWFCPFWFRQIRGHS